jgi:hypothetical protein
MSRAACRPRQCGGGCRSCRGSSLDGLPARIQLPPMPMRERLQLGAALAILHGHVAPDIDWRPLLRYTAGNPLTITVLVGQALRDNVLTGHRSASGECTDQRTRSAQDAAPAPGIFPAGGHLHHLEIRLQAV